MKIINLYPNGFGSNCYLVEDNGHALVIDPSAAAESILNAVRLDTCTLDAVILTHGHFDHIMSIDTLRSRCEEMGHSLPVMIHDEDAPMLTDGHKSAFYTFFGKDRQYRPADLHLSLNDEVHVGNSVLKVIHTPGHSPGSICLLCESEGIIFTGDTIFADSYGRYDLWGGNAKALANSIASLRELDPNLTIYPGHSQTARLGDALDNIAYLI